MLKKIIAAALAVVLTAGVAVTSAMATSFSQMYQHKNASYNYTYTGNDMKTTINGSLSSASTSASNSTGKYSRYIEVCVMERDLQTHAILKNNDANVTTTNAGTGCGIQRNASNSNVYYQHMSLIKPSVENSYVIDSTNNFVYQKY